jgi:Phosphate-selective porin O and P
MPNNRPTICSADDQNCVSITSRLHFDAGGYDYRPNTAATVPQHLNDGVNARRARIGVLGKFAGDWNYALIYDFAGSSDGFGGTASAGGTAVGFLPGGGLSGIENAYLSYTGFKPFGGKLAIEGGYMDLPYTLDEAMSSNDIRSWNALPHRSSRSILRPAMRAPRSAHAGTTMRSGLAPMRPGRPQVQFTPARASTPTARRSNLVRLRGPRDNSSAARATPCTSAQMPNS